MVVYLFTYQPGQRNALEKFNAFFVKQNFSPVIYLGFRVWCTLRSGGQVVRVKLV